MSIIVLTETPALAAVSRLSGNMSKKATAITLPAANTKKYGRLFLNLRITKPPNRVDTNVANASP